MKGKFLTVGGFLLFFCKGISESSESLPSSDFFDDPKNDTGMEAN